MCPGNSLYVVGHLGAKDDIYPVQQLMSTLWNSRLIGLAVYQKYDSVDAEFKNNNKFNLHDVKFVYFDYNI
jgi:hypothetical protein